MGNITEQEIQAGTETNLIDNNIRPGFLKRLFRLPVRMNRIHFAYLGAILSLIAIPIFVVPFILFRNMDILAIIYIPVMLYNMCLYSSRLQDINLSSWWMLFFLFPFLGPIFMLVVFVKSGTKGENRYGPRPEKRPKVEYIVVSVFFTFFFILLPFAISFLMNSDELLMMLKPA